MKILVVDDSLLVQHTIVKIISENFPGTRISSAKNGLAGLESYRRQRPDIIITDLLMPDVSGWELIQEIRESDSETKIIILTADVQNAVKKEVAELNVQGFINKPMTGEKADYLVGLIREV